MVLRVLLLSSLGNTGLDATSTIAHCVHSYLTHHSATHRQPTSRQPPHTLESRPYTPLRHPPTIATPLLSHNHKAHREATAPSHMLPLTLLRVQFQARHLIRRASGRVKLQLPRLLVRRPPHRELPPTAHPPPQRTQQPLVPEDQRVADALQRRAEAAGTAERGPGVEVGSG